MRDWTLSKIVWVADRGFSSEANRRYLRQGDHAYIIGEKLRSGLPGDQGRPVAPGPLHRASRENMRVKEVRVSDTERFVICHNPDAATRDAHIREQLVAQLDELIAGSDSLPVDQARRAAREDLHQARAEPVPAGHPRRAAAHRQGQDQDRGQPRREVPAALLATRTCRPTDIALGYKQLLEVERGWRDMKQILDLRPVYHRLEQRIRAHVVLCWLALLLIRIIETRTGQTWHHVRRDLDRLHAVTFTGPTGTFRQRTDPTKPQTDLYARLDLPLPKKIIEITPAEP